MNTFFDNIVYKGVPFDIVQANDCPAGLDNPTLRLHTYGDDSVVVNYTLSGDMVTIHIGATDLDILDDGVIYYEWANSESAITCNNTVYTLKTPEGYDPITPAEIYESGHTAGMEDQKELMVEATIVENGVYTRPDGYSSVEVIVSGGSSVDVISTAITVTQDVETIESEAGTAWSAVSVNAINYGNSRYDAGYSRGSSDGYQDGYSSGYTDGMVSGTSIGYDEGVAEQKAKLTGVTITENGQYNRPDGYSAVTVNVSGGTQEPFFGKVADMTGVGWLMDNIANSTLFEFEFICPNLSGYQNQNLYIASWDENDENLRCEYYAYDSDTKLKLDSDNTGDDFNINSINNKSVLAKLYKTSGKIDVNVIVPGAMWITSGDSVCSRTQICFFSMNFWSVQPGELPRYFKSFRVFDVGNSGNELMHIIPRSDGKMWDLVTNQEATIDWLKYDGTHPTTFNTLYEWEIPQ